MQTFAYFRAKRLGRLAGRQGSRGMTAFALLGCVLVEQNVLAFEITVVLVAPGTGHVLMQAL